MKSKFIVAVISFFLCQVVLAQVKFEAEVSRKTIGVNERVRIDFKMNQDGDNFNPPDFRGFKVVGGGLTNLLATVGLMGNEPIKNLTVITCNPTEEEILPLDKPKF